MQKLIDSWRRKARDITRQIKLIPFCTTTDLEASRDTYLHCARELAKINTFKFAVGDEVTVIESGFTGTITFRAEYMEQGKLTRDYEILGMSDHYEHELQYHRPNQGQTRSRPSRRAK